MFLTAGPNLLLPEQVIRYRQFQNAGTRWRLSLMGMYCKRGQVRNASDRIYVTWYGSVVGLNRFAVGRRAGVLPWAILLL